jgi:hypothetical protein
MLPATILLLAAAAAPSEAAAATVTRADSEAALGKLVGTWELQVSFVNCESGAPLGPPFTSLHTYLPGGSALEQGSSVGPPPSASRSVGQGVWRRESPGLFRAHIVFFNFDAGGQVLGRVEIDEFVETHGRDRILHYGVGSVFTPAGVQVARNCFTGPGERLALPEE